MKKFLLLLLTLSLIATTACGIAEKPEEELNPAPPEVTKPVDTPSPEPVHYYNPLTGLEIDEPFVNSRPFAVMINNIKFALPHCGVSQADIVYEVLAEGDITRMMAVFSDVSKAGTLGSMRSSRPYYIELALSYDAIYVHAGGSEQAYTDISAKGVDNIDGVRGANSGQIFYRDPSRQRYGIEHSLFTTSEKLLEYAPKLGYETEHETEDFDYGLHFTDTPAMSGATSASTVNVSFGGLKTTDFTYDETMGKYTCVQHGQDYIDGNTGEKIVFKNVMVLYADTEIVDNYGRRSVDLTGTGEGHFVCDGKSVPITWSRDGNGEIFEYFLSDGQPLELARGTSYIGIVPTESTITIA